MSSTLVISLGIAQQVLIRYIDLVVFVLGTFGSLMNILLYSQKNLRSNSCCIYFLVSSFATLVLISMGIIPLIYAQYNTPNPFFSINSFCKIRAYVNQWSAMSCRWLLVMACVDRCLASSANSNIRRFAVCNIARRIAALIVLIWMVFPVHVLIFNNIVPPGNTRCIMSNNNMAIYHGIYTIVMGGTLPPIVMLLCTAIIWKSLKQQNQRRAMIVMNRSERREKMRNHQVLILLLGQVVIFIISTIPFMSNTLYGALTRDVPNKTADRRAIEAFAQAITELFVYVFPASSFYSNTLVSRKFRSEWIDIFRRVPRWIRRGRIDVSSTVGTRTDGSTHDIPLTTERKFRLSSRIQTNGLSHK